MSAHQRSLWLTFADADASRIEGESPTGGHVTFLHGRQNLNSLAGTDGSLVAYRDVVYRRLWPGIDARITGASSGLKYSFEIAPHSDPRAIHLRYEGADRIAVTERGRTDDRSRRRDDHRWRTDRISARRRAHGIGRRSLHPARHRRRFLARRLRSGAAAHHRSDPRVLNVPREQRIRRGARHRRGRVRLGVHRRHDASDRTFRPTPGAFQRTFRGGTGNVPSDAFVAKINAAGTAFDYVTYWAEAATTKRSASRLTPAAMRT